MATVKLNCRQLTPAITFASSVHVCISVCMFVCMCIIMCIHMCAWCGCACEHACACTYVCICVHVGSVAVLIQYIILL